MFFEKAPAGLWTTPRDLYLICRSGSESRCWNAHRRNLPGYRATIPTYAQTIPTPTKSLPPRSPHPEIPPPPPFLHPIVRRPQPTPDLHRHRTGRRHSAPLAGGLAPRGQPPPAPLDGEPLPNVLCALLVWPLLKVKSLHCFCAELCQILAGQVSVLYDFLGREDINWRGLASELARRVYQANDLGPRSQRAFVVDDTSQARAGRKVEGTSCYTEPTKLVFGGEELNLSPAQKSPV